MAALGEDLLGIVNKLQDLVFNTIGNDSLDLPQIVCFAPLAMAPENVSGRTNKYITGRRRLAVIWKVLRPREHRRKRFLASRQWHCHTKTSDSTAHQRSQRAR